MPEEQQKRGLTMPIITGIVLAMLAAVGHRTVTTYETVLKHETLFVTYKQDLDAVSVKVELALTKIQDHLREEAKKDGRLDTMQHDMSQMNEGLKGVQTSMEEVKALLVELKTRQDMRDGNTP